MTKERWLALMEDDSLKLTAEEIQEGCHFCCEFDGLLVTPGMGELACCQCLPKEHPVYATISKEHQRSPT